jgi:hypothetical protein
VIVKPEVRVAEAGDCATPRATNATPATSREATSVMTLVSTLDLDRLNFFTSLAP